MSTIHLPQSSNRLPTPMRTRLLAVAAILLLGVTMFGVLRPELLPDFEGAFPKPVPPALKGVRIAVARDVAPDTHRIIAGISPQCVELIDTAYGMVREEKERNSLFLMNADGTGRRTLLSSSQSFNLEAASPDGRSLYVKRWEGPGLPSYLVAIDTVSGEERGFPGAHDIFGPVLMTPDGQNLVFIRRDEGTKRTFHAYAILADGSNLHRLTPTEARATGIDAFLPDAPVSARRKASQALMARRQTSPDGGFLLNSKQIGTNWGLTIVPAKGGTPIELTGKHPMPPLVHSSDDGIWLPAPP